MDGKRKGFLAALVIGLVAAPGLALVASGLLGGEAVAYGSPTTAAAASPAAAASAAGSAVGATADLETACTIEGGDLVAREAAGTLSELQQAALDSLRLICAAEGFSLEAPTAVEPSIAALDPSPSAAATEFDDDADEAGYEDEYEDDYEDEYEDKAEDEDGSQSQYEDHEDESEGREPGEHEDEG